MTDVDAARYEASPGWYRFYLGGTPRRECTIYPDSSGAGQNVICSVTFPAGTQPVTVPPFGTKTPNAVVLTGAGYYPTISEGGPPGAELLPANTRIVVDDVECTAVTGGFKCASGTAQVRFVDGQLTMSGPEFAPPAMEPSTPPTTTTARPATGDAPMDHYTDGTTPAAPGTMCGAATGRRVVTVVSGTISCTDALAVMDTYRNLPAGDYGNANIRQFDGWNCAAPTAKMSHDLGYGSRCSKGDIMLTTPVSAY
ncbi:hypothetical protein [Prescottella agglutinans]|uniref:hypothetical protein n=1 Tax=Prescottella agglutinans TaxID=1644129 RepID=UPI002473AC25|nr:hypothetical protein [Prescottella agglutinans]